MRKKRVLPLICLISLILLSCSTMPERVTGIEAERILAEKSQLVNQRRLSLRVLSAERVGRTGYFYQISSDGVLLFHPNAILEGTDFSELSSVKVILSKERGFVTEESDGMRRTIYFVRLDDGTTLCLTIDSSDIVK